MVNSESSPSIMASMGLNMGDQSPLFALNEEEPAEDGEVNLADRHVPRPTPTSASVLNKQMSMVSVQFDKGKKVRLGCRRVMHIPILKHVFRCHLSPLTLFAPPSPLPRAS
mmetsp:Transcript_6419/g.11740  ORF Transcript_6419/g.11740 Transcript_6419/m.11740 type:complete len:111 (-) Transcript_6419:1006-1338(-)